MQPLERHRRQALAALGMAAELGRSRALYSISVTSELTGVNPQMLRAYESRGLLAPYRTEGATRRYSGHDLERIGEITELLAAGLNLAGVEHVFQLQAETAWLRAELDELRQQVDKRESSVRRRNQAQGKPMD